jgi:hypothetical protein
MRERFVQELNGRERLEANRLVLARQELQLSVTAFDEDDFRLAAHCLFKASRLSPSMMSSPVLGPVLAVGLGKAIVGGMLPKRAALALRRHVREVRSLWSGDPVRGRTASMAPDRAT